MKQLWKWLSALMMASVLASCGGNDDTYGDLVDVAGKNQLNALLVAVDKAQLRDALKVSEARLTVLAPSDAAFTALATQLGFADAGALVNALSPGDLRRILSYHLIAGTKDGNEIRAAGTSLTTTFAFDGALARLGLNTASGIVLTDAVLATATVTQADLRADNGIIHVIDKVLVPPGVLNVVQMAQVNPNAFSSLVAAVVATGLGPTLAGPGPFTVFAPNNAAFAAAPDGLSTAQLGAVLSYHVLPSQVLASAIPFGTPVATLDTITLAGETVPAQTITINSNLSITDTTATPAPILATDVRASNGVIHVIGKVLIPR